jgi:predicted DsbA family dithiol-disulfide isomerase
MTAQLSATWFSDPACPWGYSENPALRVIEWRYGDQIDWDLVLIGLSEDTSGYAARGMTPARQIMGQPSFRERYGMPFAMIVKSGLSASARACRAVIAARQQWPGSEWAVFRTLQLANFNTPLLFDDDDLMREVLSYVPGVDADRIVSLIDAPEVVAEYESDKAKTRTAEGSPTEFQGKASNRGGAVRYTAPSVVFETADGERLEAGGFQPVEAYDVVIANLTQSIDRKAPPEDPAQLLDRFELGLTTQEVAAVMAHGNDPVDRDAAEQSLLELVRDGRAERHAFGDDAVWTAPGGPTPPRIADRVTAAAV